MISATYRPMKTIAGGTKTPVPVSMKERRAKTPARLNAGRVLGHWLIRLFQAFAQERVNPRIRACRQFYRE
jgi:hypothetical protein